MDWEGQVKPLLLDYLSDLPDIDIELYSYDPSKKDNDFIKLLTKTNRYELEDYINIIGLNKKQSEVLKNALDNNKIKNTIGIQSLEGFGEKSLIKVREFSNNSIEGKIKSFLISFRIPTINTLFLFCGTL